VRERERENECVSQRERERERDTRIDTHTHAHTPIIVKQSDNCACVGGGADGVDCLCGCVKMATYPPSLLDDVLLCVLLCVWYDADNRVLCVCVCGENDDDDDDDDNEWNKVCVYVCVCVCVCVEYATHQSYQSFY